MRIRKQSLVGLLGGLLVIVPAFVTACGDDPATTPDPSLPDGATNLPDSGTIDSSATPVDAATPIEAGGDAGDGSAPTNNSTWAATAGLPSAACAAWTLTDTSVAKSPVIAGGLMTLATDAIAETMFYSQSGADIITPAKITVEARVRVVAGSTTNPSRGPVTIVVRYGAPIRTAAFYLSTTEAFLNTGELTKGTAATVTTTDAAHTYRLEIDTTTHAITTTRDGAALVTGTAYVEPDTSAPKAVIFGEGSIIATGSSEWASFTHNAHALANCP